MYKMDKKTKVQEVLGSITKNLECSICLDLLNNPVSTKCDHPFCRFCILEFLEKKRSVPCPLCKAPITKRSLNDRPQLNSMVEAVRSLIQAFQEDTGAIFSPPRGPALMNLTPCTPEPVPLKAVRGTKRKIITDSPQGTNTRHNCRQSKRKKSLDLPDDKEPDEVNVKCNGRKDNKTDENELLRYLDQGSCGADQDHSNMSESFSAKNDMLHKTFELGTDKQSVQRTYNLRSPKTGSYKHDSTITGRDSCITSPIIGKIDLYKFNDTPTTPVHLLGHRRKCVNNEKNSKDLHLTVASVQAECMNDDKLEHNTTELLGRDTKSLKEDKICVQHQGRNESNIRNEFSIVTEKNSLVEPRMEGLSEEVQKNQRTRQNRKNESEAESSPDFHVNERCLCEENLKTYARQKNKPSNIKTYSKVNSWLKENILNQTENYCGGIVEEEESSLKGGNSVIDQTIEDGPKIDQFGDQSTSIIYNKENLVNEPIEIINKKDEIKNKGKDTVCIFKSKKDILQNTSVENYTALQGDEQLQPIVSQKRRIFKTTPTTQTTSVCQKKGVLVIKKVSPVGTNPLNDNHVNNKNVPMADNVTDPFEFKSSQKTPIISENKKNRNVTKGHKDKLKGKLDLRFSSGKNVKSIKSSNTEISENISKNNYVEEISIDEELKEQENLDSENKGNEDRESLSAVKKLIVGCELKNCGNLVQTIMTTEETDDTQFSVIPGSDESSKTVMKMRKSNKISGKLSNKLMKMKEQEKINEKDMEKIMEKINAAEDFDLLTCTQEVMESMDSEIHSNGKMSDDVVPDTADLQESTKRKKSVSFASDNIEISGTPRQRKRSVPMLEDRNKGRMLPKETRRGSKTEKNMCEVNILSAGPKKVEQHKKNKNCAVKRMDSRKPFVWEDEENQSDDSASTDDLNINPSQEEFEMPSYDQGQSDHSSMSVPVHSQEETTALLKKFLPVEMINKGQCNNVMSEVQNSPSKNKGSVKSSTSSPRSFLHENLTRDQDLSKNGGNVFVENTQQEVDVAESTQQEVEAAKIVEGMEIIVIPESFEDVLFEEHHDLGNKFGEGKIADKSDNFQDNNGSLRESESHLNKLTSIKKQERKKEIEIHTSLNLTSGCVGQNECMRTDIVNLYQDSESTLNESQSTLSTVDGSLDCGKVVRKSHKKLRAKKCKSQDCHPTCNQPETPSLIAETPASVSSGLEGKSTVSDTCSTSQESVSILIPVENIHCVMGDNSKTGNDLKGGYSNNKISSEESVLNINEKEKNVPCHGETIMDSNKELSDSASLDPGVDVLSGRTSLKFTKATSKCHLQTANNLRASHAKCNKNKKNYKLQSDPPIQNLGNTREIYVDSDVEFIGSMSVSIKNEMQPIILSGNDSFEKTETQQVVKSKMESDIETIQETMETQDKLKNKNHESVIHTISKEKRKSQNSQQSIDGDLTPTLVSQKTLKLRNSAEKKRLSAERQFFEQTQVNDKKSGIINENMKVQENCSPEDIFLMDSELQSSGSLSMPQNQEGLMCLDLEPSEEGTSVQSCVGVSQNALEIKSNQYPIQVNGAHQKDLQVENTTIEHTKDENLKYTQENSCVAEMTSLRKKLIKDSSDTEQDSSPDKKAKKGIGKRTVRGLARKKHSQKTRAHTPTSDVEYINIGRNSEKMSSSSPNACPTGFTKTPLNNQQESLTAAKIPQSKISPTFAYSPQKPQKSKQVKLKFKKTSLNMAAPQEIHVGQKSTENANFDEEDSNSDVVMVTINKFDKLIKDNIAETEMSDNDETEKVLYDKSNMSDDVTLMEETDVKMNENVTEIDMNKLPINDSFTNKQNELNWVEQDQELDSCISGSFPANDMVQERRQRSTSFKSFEKLRQERDRLFSKSQKNCEENLKMDIADESDLDLEPSSPLPDMIGNDTTLTKEVLHVSEAEDDDALLIKSGQNVYDLDRDAKHSYDLKHKSKNSSKTNICQQKQNGQIVNIEEVQDQGENSDDNEDDVVNVRRKRRRIIDDDSDSSDESDDSSSGRHLDNTSSSAFSSQSEPINTQQRNQLESDLERMRREMKELEAQLAAGSSTHKEDEKETDEEPVSPNSDVIQEFYSDEELFVSPRPPSPPPMSPQQIDLATVETDFMSEFRKHDLELSPNHSSSNVGKEPVQFDHDEAICASKHEFGLERSTLINTINNVEKNVSKIEAKTEILNKPNPISHLCKVQAPKLMYSPLIKGDNSPISSPLSRKGSNVLSPLVSNSVEAQRSQKCFVSTGLVVPQMKELQRLAVLNQCKFLTKFSKEVTHVIVKTDPIGSHVCDRTLKFFQGISQKCWILDYKWVKDSREAGHLLPEVEYEIKGDTVTEDFHYGPRRARLSSSRPLFDHIQFVVIGNSTGLQIDDLKSLLRTCGGCVKSDIEDITDSSHAIVVTCSDYDNETEDEDVPPPEELHKFNEFYSRHGIISVSREWVLDSLTVYKLQPIVDYILTPGNMDKNNIPNFCK